MICMSPGRPSNAVYLSPDFRSRLPEPVHDRRRNVVAIADPFYKNNICPESIQLPQRRKQPMRHPFNIPSQINIQKPRHTSPIFSK